MTERWATISDLHLNEEGYEEFDVDEFVEKYQDAALDGIAYLGDAVSRPDLHDDLKESDRVWADYLKTYHGFMDDLDSIAERLGVDVYFGKGNNDPDPDAHGTREGIETMQDVHEDVARADFNSAIENHAAAEGNEDLEDVEDPYAELDDIFNPEEDEAFEYNRRDSSESLFSLDHLREGEERVDETIRGYLLDQFDNLKDGEFQVLRGDEHDFVMGSSFLDREFDPEAEQTGGLYEMDEFEEIAEMIDTEPFYDSWKRKGGLFGMAGDAFGSIADTVNTGAEYLSNAREMLFGEYESDDSEESVEETDDEEEWELSENFSFKDIPYEEANAEQRRYINRLAMMESLVEQVERPAVVMDHGMPNLNDTEANLDVVDGAHKGSMVWRELMEENSDNIGSFVGGHFHGKGYRRVDFQPEGDDSAEQDIVNTSEVYSDLRFHNGMLESYETFQADGTTATHVLEQPTETEDIFERIGMSEDEIRGLQRSPQVPNNLTESVRSLLQAGDEDNARTLVSDYASDL